MKRTYYNSEKRKKLTRDALAQMRQARSRIDPALLAEARRLIARQMPEQRDRTDGALAVDRKKNMLTVMKFLELKAGNKVFCQKIRALLSEI